MGVPSGSFSDARSGQLAVAFAGTFYSSGNLDFTSTSQRIALKCTISNGGTVLWTGSITNSSPSAYAQVTYTGGTTLDIAITELSHNAGVGYVSATNLQIAAQLFKNTGP